MPVPIALFQLVLYTYLDPLLIQRQCCLTCFDLAVSGRPEVSRFPSTVRQPRGTNCGNKFTGRRYVRNIDTVTCLNLLTRPNGDLS